MLLCVNRRNCTVVILRAVLVSQGYGGWRSGLGGGRFGFGVGWGLGGKGSVVFVCVCVCVFARACVCVCLARTCVFVSVCS